jgi:serine/threonine protein kinase
MPFEIGQRVGDYEILELLGTGGMGHVYRARNIISDRTEAMKVLLPDLSAERDLAVRFISEIRTLAGFDHPNIALLHTAFQSDNQLIMVMEYVEGYTLEQRAKQSPLTVSEIADYTSQALSALSYAHERNVIHRDIKPANLMVTPHGVVKLMDFGIAKSSVDINLTRPGTTIGSFYYMSPEQVRGSTVDGRSDLYSLGVVLYELLAGRRPFESDSTYGVLNQQLNEAPRPPIEIKPSLSPQLNAIILTALAKDPADRFQNADAFRNALRGFRTASAAESGAPKSAMGSAPTAPGSAAFKDVSAPKDAPGPSSPAAGTPQAAATQGASPKPRNNKPLWIATGALAAMLALIAVAVMVPKMLKTHASESNPAAANPAAASSTPAGPSTSQPASTPATPDTTTTPATNPAPASNPLVDNTPSSSRLSSGGSAAHTQAPTRPVYKAAGGGIPTPSSGSQAQQAQQPPMQNSGPSQAEVEQSQERMIQLGSRTDAVDRSISQLRHQQEADGLGLRNDMETADNQMRAYMQAANQDMQASRIAAANRNMDKAEAQLQILEKFLGK